MKEKKASSLVFFGLEIDQHVSDFDSFIKDCKTFIGKFYAHQQKPLSLTVASKLAFFSNKKLMQKSFSSLGKREERFDINLRAAVDDSLIHVSSLSVQSEHLKYR